MPGDAPSFHLRIDGLAVPEGPNEPLLLDLLGLAAAIHVKDKTTWRRRSSGSGRFRGRTISLTVPVRRPDFWRDDRVRAQVDDLVRAMTGDDAEITFTRATRADSALNCFHAGRSSIDGVRADAIIGLSGGLDSAAGARMEAVEARRRVVLLSQRTPFAEKAQVDVVTELRRIAPQARIEHVTFSCSSPARPRENAESTATFLRAAVAAVAADASGAESILFHADGVTSWGLPLTDFENVTNRALAPTHPALLAKVGALLARTTELPLVVGNPFSTATKGEVIRRLGDYPRLVAATSSCERTIGRSHGVRFCGLCPSCLERRVAVMAAGMGEHDDATRYAVDAVAGVREAGGERVLGEAFVRTAQELATATPAVLALRFPEIFGWANALGDGEPGEIAQAIADVHARHGREVLNVLGRSAQVTAIQQLGSGCVLAMVQRARGRGPVRPKAMHDLVLEDGTVRLDGVEVVSKKATALYTLIDFLAREHEKVVAAAKANNTEPDTSAFPTFRARKLLKLLEKAEKVTDSNELRIWKYIDRLRSEMTEKLARERRGTIRDDEIIEGDGGYRLNPRRVRVIILTKNNCQEPSAHLSGK